ncbi:alpha/beta hydrolase-fold protein [soil metagenome]
MTAMEPRRWRIHGPAIGGDGEVWAYGHYGRPVLAFPSQQGAVGDFALHGMVYALEDLLTAGRIKLYCVESLDGRTWFDDSLPIEERARRHRAYASWLYDHVAPAIREDCGGRDDTITTGASFGAYHAVHATLQRADLFPTAIGLSGVYDLERIGAWGEPGDDTYFANPSAYVGNLEGGHLDWLREAAELILVCGQGQWEDTSGALDSTRAFAGQAVGQGLRVHLDLWGHDMPHDWPSWRRMLAHHLDRIC